MNIDERIEALTQSLERLASIHADNEKRLTRMESALTAALKAFIEEWTRNGGEAK
jgi:hypothetical protein